MTASDSLMPKIITTGWESDSVETFLIELPSSSVKLRECLGEIFSTRSKDPDLSLFTTCPGLPVPCLLDPEDEVTQANGWPCPVTPILGHVGAAGICGKDLRNMGKQF